MASRSVVVLDAGTSSVRCLVFDHHGRISAARSTEWRYLDVPDASPFAREFDAASVWSGVCALINGTLRDAGSARGQVAVVTATSQRQGVVFLDRAGREIYAGPNLDLRAVFEGGAIDELMRDVVYETTGHTPSFLFAPAKLRWFQLHRADAYGRIASVLSLADWLVYKLSGELLSEPSLAGEAGLLDIHRRQWCTRLLDDLGLIGNSHVPLVSPGTVAGRVNAAVSRETGVPVGTPVVVSGADTQCGLLGAGVAREGQVGIVAGWSAALQMVSYAPILAPSRRTWAGCFLMPDRWVLESSAGDAGNSYEWLVRMVLHGGANAFSDMDGLAGAVPAGSEETLAFLGPSRMDMSNVGLRQGCFWFPVPLTFATIGKGHLARAAMEAIAYAMKANLKQCEEMSGTRAAVVSVGGGMTRSATWTTILVDVLGRPVGVSPTPHVSALGAYLCAATAIGEFASLEEAADGVRGRLETVDPDSARSTEYQDYYKRWTEISGRMKEVAL